MGHHIDSEGRFQSDKYPDLPPDKVVLSLKDPTARSALLVAARAYLTVDAEFATDLGERLVGLDEELAEVTLIHSDSGWHWWETDVPEEGSAGPYATIEEALADMCTESVVTTLRGPGA